MNNNIVKVWSILSIVSLLFITITFLREIVFASCFGVTYFVDAYAIAAQIPEALFFVMCQALGAITIPIYSKLICTDGKTVADKFISNLISVISISLLLLIAICIVCSDIFIYIFAPGLPDATHKLAVSLLRWTLPILLFEIIIVMHISILNVHNVFIRPKLFSGIRFIVMIIMMVAFHKVIGIYSAVFGWLMGVIAELIAYLIISHKYRVYRFSFNLKDSNFIKAYKQAVPIVISSGVAELNQIADKIISSFLAVGSIASLGYASKISNIVYIVFINNIITICYPRLAKYYSLDQEKKLILFFSKSLRYIIIVCLPLIIGGSIFKNELITLAFGRGAFNLSSVNNIGNIFMCYLITTIFAAIVLMSSKVFIIYGDLRIILYNSILGLSLNVVLNLILVRYFSTLGLAIATCISTSVVCIRIILLLERKFSFNIVSYISLTLGKSAIATLFMGLVIIFIRRLYIMFIGFTTYWHIFILLLLAFVCGVFIYLIFLWLLRLEDIYILKNILVKQGSHK